MPKSLGLTRMRDLTRRMQRLPFAELDRIAPGTSLILAPHPDDETLGCGGLIASACERGRPPLIVAVTDGAGSHPGSRSHPPARLKALREAELRTAVGILGAGRDRVQCLGIPDTHVPQTGPGFDRAVATIAMLARTHGITTIFATWQQDPHCDHQATARIAAAAAGLAGTDLLFYPVWGWLLPPDQALPVGQVQGVRLDMAAHLPRKRRALAAHASQYGGLITDDPDGFSLPADLLAVFDRPFEVFLRA